MRIRYENMNASSGRTNAVIIAKMLRSCRRNLGLILALALLTSAASYAVLRHLPPEYTARSIVFVGAGEADIIASDSAWSTIGDRRGNTSEEGATLEALFTSVPVLRRVAVNLALDERPQVLRSRVARFMANLRQSAERSLGIDLDGDSEEDDAAEGVADAGRSERSVQVSALGDAGVATVDAASPGEMARALREERLRAAVNHLANNIEVVVDRYSEIAFVGYSGPNPTLAARVANELPAAFASERRARVQAESSGAADWLAARVDEVRAELSDAERRLERFKAENGLSSSGSNASSAAQLDRLVAAVEAADRSAAEASERLRRARASVADSRVDQDLFNSAIMQRLLALKATEIGERSNLLSRVGQDHALVRAADNRIRELDRDIAVEKARLLEEVEGAAASAQREVEYASERLIEAQDRIAASGGTGSPSTLEDLQQEVDATRTLYGSLVARLKQAQQLGQLETGMGRIIQPALVPSYPSSIGSTILVAGTGFGTLALGLMFAAGISLLDRRIAHVDEVTRFGFDTVVSVPNLDPRSARKGGSRRLGGDALQAQLLFDEAMRRLLVSTLYDASGPGSRVVMVTSGSKHEGKSTISAALAKRGAAGGTSTVLVEGDLRRPGSKVEDYRSRNVGLSGLLEGRGSLDEVLVRDEAGGYTILPTTRPVQSSTELLGSKHMRTLIEELTKRFDFVVIDTPPVCLTPDPEVLARYADDIVFVIKHDASTLQRTGRAIELLTRIFDRSPIAAVNMTDIDFIDAYYGPGDHVYPVAGGNPAGRLLGRLFGGSRRARATD